MGHTPYSRSICLGFASGLSFCFCNISYLSPLYVWFNLVMTYDFLTDKLGKISNVRFMGKLGFIGWNFIMLGNLFRFLNY